MDRANKGVLAWESHTSTQLVSPATGHEKIFFGHSWNSVLEDQIEYIRAHY